MAAALCCRFDCTPHELYLYHLEALKEAMRKEVRLHLPCDWGNAPHEACHFMRPAGSCGNPDGEDCWLHFNPETPQTPIHESLAENIRELKLSHPDGTPFEI